jgi:hypothetical protein
MTEVNETAAEYIVSMSKKGHLAVAYLTDGIKTVHWQGNRDKATTYPKSEAEDWVSALNDTRPLGDDSLIYECSQYVKVDYARLPDGSVDHSHCGAFGYLCCDECAVRLQRAEQR